MFKQQFIYRSTGQLTEETEYTKRLYTMFRGVRNAVRIPAGKELT